MFIEHRMCVLNTLYSICGSSTEEIRIRIEREREKNEITMYRSHNMDHMIWIHIMCVCVWIIPTTVSDYDNTRMHPFSSFLHTQKLL